tara:strand:- start:1423 stop:2226 length:804 start_codon:yes stop_codon:yes gene_type:complete
MTLIIQKPTGAKLNLAQGWDLSGFDADAAAYIQRVEWADTTPLEAATRTAINSFVVGCKADGIWTAIKASCILSGARTLSGALMPLAGSAPTNVNFVSGDYNRKTGLVGDGSTKYLDSNRNSNADPQNSFHMTCYRTAGALGGSQTFIGNEGGTTSGSSVIIVFGSSVFFRNRNSGAQSVASTAPNFIGSNRSTSSAYTARVDGTTNSYNISSQTPRNQTISLFSAPGGGDYSSFRIAFYSIGESLNLALLDARVTDLINAFAAAIP